MVEHHENYSGGPFFIFDCDPLAFRRFTSDLGPEPTNALVLIGPGAMTTKVKVQLSHRPDFTSVIFGTDADISRACTAAERLELIFIVQRSARRPDTPDLSVPDALAVVSRHFPSARSFKAVSADTGTVITRVK